MHPSSVENMKLVRQKYLGYLEQCENPKVLDVAGIYDKPNKTYLRLFEDISGLEWDICDIEHHPTCTIAMSGPYSVDCPDNHFDLVVSGQMLEHCENPFKSVAEMKRVVKKGSCIVLIVPSTGPHHTKVDGWRFLDDAFRFICNDIGGIEIVADWIQRDAPDERSRKWSDHVFVGRKL